MADSIFTKIIKGEIPCHKIYEDDRVIAFLDIHPIRPGHVLVVPKTQIGRVWELSDDDYGYLMSVVKHIAKQIKLTLDSPRVGMFVDGYDTADHAHIHLLPLTEAIEQALLQYIEGGQKEPDHSALAKIAQQIAL